MNWFQSILYGFISGLTEFLPISSQAHQAIFGVLSGSGPFNPLYQLLVHIGCLVAVISCSKSALGLLRREQRHLRHHRHFSNVNTLDSRVVKTAVAPLLIGLLVIRLSGITSDNLLILSVYLVINGVILYVPERMLQGNKDAGAMSALDSILIGSLGILSAIPGISQIGCTTSVAVARGADRQHALKWSLLLSVYMIAALCVLDIVSVFSRGAPLSFLDILYGLLSACSAYAGGYISIRLIRFLTVKNGFSGFAFYSWGAALFSFILYLTAV